MRIGIILHGPEIVDIGSAQKIIDVFKKEHYIIARLGGTMGRTAVLDAGLENVIDISKGLTPSETIIAMKNDIDLVILLNHGKTLDTGRYFGRIVASKLDNLLPFVHIESPDNNGRIIYYYPSSKRYAEFVRDSLAKYGTYDLPVELGPPEPSHVRIDGGSVIRSIGGALIGENIRLDGVVIGEIITPDVEIVCRDGKIIRLEGIKAKPHGLEKLDNRTIDLSTAKVKTGGIRRTRPKPRIKDIPKYSKNKVAIIDHAAESTFELVHDAGLVITVGDDTTAIAADILARLGVPVIGIIDGDVDNVLTNAVVPEGSMIIRVRPGFDDVVGREVFREIMQGKHQFRHDKDDLTAKIIALAEKYVVEVTYY